MDTLLHAVLLSLAVFAAIALLPIDTQGQPQGKDQSQEGREGRRSRRPSSPTACGIRGGLAWLPNGDMLVTERNGKLRLVHDGVLDPRPSPGVPAVHSVRLSGLNGDPAASPTSRRIIFVYLTYTKGRRARLGRHHPAIEDAVGATRRSLPLRSVTSMSPLGSHARLHGCHRPLAMMVVLTATFAAFLALSLPCGCPCVSMGSRAIAANTARESRTACKERGHYRISRVGQRG